MNVVGLITEYNPFHNGHKYHIEQARKITNAEYVIVVMSGNFVQRGTPAVLDKYIRTEMCLTMGADLVIELPTCYASASAESFALGAVSILDHLGIVTHLVFGSECGNISDLTQVAHILAHESDEISSSIKEYLKEGITYPHARSKALLTHCNFTSSDGTNFEELLNSPNNILGIEYIKALKLLSSTIIPQTITRIGAGYHNSELTESICSASALRQAFSRMDVNKNMPSSLPDELKKHIPKEIHSIYESKLYHSFPIMPSNMTSILKYKLLTETCDSLLNYLDMTKDIAYRISNQKYLNCTYEEIVNLIKSKQYTQTRIQRILTHILLGITTDDMKKYKEIGYTPYARILGFRKSSSKLLKEIYPHATLTPIVKVATDINKLDSTAKKMLELDLYASNLYNLFVYDEYKVALRDDYTHGLVMLP